MEKMYKIIVLPVKKYPRLIRIHTPLPKLSRIGPWANLFFPFRELRNIMNNYDKKLGSSSSLVESDS
jgi:hypothetical protein